MTIGKRKTYMKCFLTLDRNVKVLKIFLNDPNSENEEALIETFSFYKCFTKPTTDNINLIIQELGYQEVIQKPRYMAKLH